MGIRFDPSLIPRYDSSLLRYLNENFQQMKRLLARASILDSGTTEPGDPSTGDLWVNTTRKTLEIYTGTEFLPVGSYESIDWSPVISQPGAIGRTIISCTYQYRGDFIEGDLLVSITGTGTANTEITITKPVASLAAINAGQHVGEGYLYNANLNVRVPVSVIMTATVMKMGDLGISSGVHIGSTGSAFNEAVVNTDALALKFRYRWR
jgi:hypothetical protein